MIRGRVALVLGAGGPVGHAFHAGVLHALERVAGWDPRRADLVVGTSAGAQVGALTRAGMNGSDLSARVTGAPMSSAGAAIARHYHRPSHSSVRTRPYAPASLAYLRRALARPFEARPGRLIAAALPLGEVSLEPQAAGFRALFGSRWPGDRLWLSAVHLDSGEAVAFGRSAQVLTDVGSAVASSCAVPGICMPVTVSGRGYVDGGVASATHLDLIDEPFDWLLVSSPLSMFAMMRLVLRRELERAARYAQRTLVFEPSGRALAAMGLNPMDVTRMAPVARSAFECARARIEGC